MHCADSSVLIVIVLRGCHRNGSQTKMSCSYSDTKSLDHRKKCFHNTFSIQNGDKDLYRKISDGKTKTVM